uniref:Uncharacterized protein n=1 Tax=Timema poppense TaxID=170557 RepID=A0A7R9CSG9_TIMPO|nr:unnamed protein product [Timema poppensis]
MDVQMFQENKMSALDKAILTQRPLSVDEDSANFCGYGYGIAKRRPMRAFQTTPFRKIINEDGERLVTKGAQLTTTVRALAVNVGNTIEEIWSVAKECSKANAKQCVNVKLLKNDLSPIHNTQ